jgi:hypothetical protein
MTKNIGMQFQISTHWVERPPGDELSGLHHWMAVATTTLYSEIPIKNGLINRAQMILTTEALRVVSGRASAATEEAAVSSAIQALRFQLAAVHDAAAKMQAET